MSRAATGRKKSPETIEKLRVSRLGKKASLKTRAKLSLAKIGNQNSVGRIPWNRGKRMPPLSKIAKEKIRQSRLSHMENPPENCQCAPHKQWNKETRTNLEVILEGLLSEFPEIQIQKSFGHFCVDAYLPPPYHLAFEADGSYWHKFPRKDAVRDAYLLRKYGLPVIRLSEKDLLGISS